jgi:hypothetical protein
VSFRSRVRPYIQDKSVLLSEQFNYGHREILVASNQLKPNTLFSCNIQHGWFGDYTGVKPIFNKLQRPYPRLVWSTRVREALLKTKSGTPIVTGAPWVHFLRACKIEPAKIFEGLQTEKSKTARLLVFPNHSIAGLATSHQSCTWLPTCLRRLQRGIWKRDSMGNGWGPRYVLTRATEDY